MIVVVVVIFLILWAGCGAVWFIGGDWIRPPWLDWGLDGKRNEPEGKPNEEQSDEPWWELKNANRSFRTTGKR